MLLCEYNIGWVSRCYLATRWINLKIVSLGWIKSGSKTYLKVLIVKVPNHAKRAISKVAVKAFWREQIERE